MSHERDGLGYGRIFTFWYPLALTWLMMAAEGPFLAAVVARMARPKENLAAYGIALAVAILVEAPIIMMMSAATALVRDRDSFLKLRAFTYGLNLFITLAMALLLFSGAMDFICRSWIGLSEPVTRRVYSALVLLLPWPGAIGYRRFYQGVLIRSGLTRRVAYGTVVRLCSMAACALLLFGFSHMHGADTAAAALSTGVIMEAAAARLMARAARRRLLRVPPAPSPENGPLTYGAIARFYYPLALTSTLALVVPPMVSFFVGHSRMALESLAVIPVVNSLVFLFRALGLSYLEAAIALLKNRFEGYGKLRNFAAMLALAVTGGLALITLTPLANFWFEKVSGLERFLADFAVPPTLILTPFPALTVLLSMERAVLVKGGRTLPVTHATLLEVAGVLAVLYTGVEPLHLTGAVAASVALIAGRSLGILYLLRPCRAVLRKAGRP